MVLKMKELLGDSCFAVDPAEGQKSARCGGARSYHELEIIAHGTSNFSTWIKSSGAELVNVSFVRVLFFLGN